MAKLWNKPTYDLRDKNGKSVVIDVTKSVSAGLPPNKLIKGLIPFFKSRNVERIVDFGAGALRHSFPLLKRGFEICAVEFEEQFNKPFCQVALAKARRYSNFSTLIWPRDFKNDNRTFDAALLCYVLQTMPIADERDLVLKLLYRKLRDDSYLLYMSRLNQMEGTSISHKVEDGYYKRPEEKTHSFYREFTPEETRQMFENRKFRRIRSLSERGTEQIHLYVKGSATWA
jgi:SAM-dependent methyltransferase